MQQTLGVHGQLVTLGQSADGPSSGTLGPFSWKGSKKALCTATPSCTLGATPVVCALKCQLCVIFGQGPPLCL